MPIRLKILLGALALTAVTAVFGLYSQSAEQRLRTLSFRLYDDAFMAMSYLRAAQDELLATGDAALSPAAAKDMAGDLEVARTRAMSGRGRQAATDLLAHLDALEADDGEADQAKLMALHNEFDETVELFAGDAFRYRRQVGEVMAQTSQGSLIALAGSVLAAAFISLALTRSIVPPVRAAVAVAEAIAGGRLNNVIRPRGRSETAQLLRALSIMQEAIATHVGRVQALLEQQAREHAEATRQQAKVDALVQCFGAAIGGVFRSVSAASDQVAATATQLTAGAAEIVAAGRGAEGQLARSVDSIEASSTATRSLSEALRAIGGEAAQTEARALATLAETAAARLRMEQTRDVAGEIERMVAVISNIAGQTRMLALNATIEASHAGPAGRGFSVVADEVKKLSQNTSAAAVAVAERVGRIVEAAAATAAGIGAIDASAQQVHALSASIAASVALQDAAAEQLWGTIWEVSVNAAQVRAGVGTTLGVTADSARGLAEIGGSAIQLAHDAAGLSLEVAEFLEVVGSIKGGEAIDMVGLDRPATLHLAGMDHAGRVVCGSGVMVHFAPAVGTEPGAAGLLRMDGLPEPLPVRVAGCDGAVLQLQPPLARPARARLQAGLAGLAA